MPPPPALAQSIKTAGVNVSQALFNPVKASSGQFNLLLFGAPGVGKGTFGKLIQRDFAFQPFSTGDYFRDVIKQAKLARGPLDPFTQSISELLASGRLVDDQTVIDIVRRLKEHPETFADGRYAGAPGLILDGVPRTIRQAEMLSEFADIDLVLNFYNREDILLQKLAGRRVCPECNKGFNVADVNSNGYVMAPLLPEGDDPTVCDADHGQTDIVPIKLVTRPDDKEDVILKRLELYEKETLPILDYYKTQTNARVVDFEAKRGKADYHLVEAVLAEALGDQREQLTATAQAYLGGAGSSSARRI